MLSSDFPVPYTSRLSEPFLTPGQSLVFQGSINSDARHFELSLIGGVPNSGQERIALQICFHFEVGITVLNSMLENGEWGEEEFHSNPFFHGKPFDVRIRVHEDQFDLFVNQMPWAVFRHRMDFRQIDHIQASGEISLSAVHWGGRYFEMPYEMAFHDHALESGQRLFVYGIPKGDFAVSLIGDSSEELFRMNALFDQQIVVRNAQTNNEWGAEESESQLLQIPRGEERTRQGGRRECAAADGTEPMNGPRGGSSGKGDFVKEMLQRTNSDQMIVLFLLCYKQR